MLQEEIFELAEIYSIYPDYLIEKMTEAEKNSIIHEFTPVLFPELKILVADVFENVF